MVPANRDKLAARVVQAAEAALQEQNYVSPIDVLLGIGWLDGGTEKRWLQGQMDCLEEAIQTNPNKVSEAMEQFRQWATAKGLLPRESQYVSKTRDRRTLRFTIGGDPTVEQAYRTHWISPTLSEKQRARLAEKTDRPPDLVVVMPLNRDWKCHRCGGTGGFLVMENAAPACMRCLEMDDLEFVPSGDALLTRRLKAKSTRAAVVVRFSRSRKRYERQGILVEPSIIAEVESEIAKGQGRREAGSSSR